MSALLGAAVLRPPQPGSRRRESRRPRATKVLSVGQPLTQQALKLGEDALRCVVALATPFCVCS